MKKHYLFLILFSCFVNAQIINFPDSNFKAKLLSSDPTNTVAYGGSAYLKIDVNSDGEIQVAEAKAIDSLNINSANIADLDGISNFSNLVKLNCNQNRLASLDFTGLINLQLLDCSYNKFTSINLSGLINLYNLNCSQNQLTTLDLTNTINLKQLNFYNNQITSINLNGLNNLTTLDCSENPLGILDFSGLNNLTSLKCYNNLLTSLDLTGLNNLTSLSCYNNQLTTLDLTLLNKLVFLNCEANQLTSLDLNNQINLTFLNCGRNQLTSLNLTTLINLFNLSCNENSLGSLDLTGLINLTSLYCYNNQISSLNLAGLNNITRLYCDNNQLTSLDLTGLINLGQLGCSYNQIPSLDFTGLSSLGAVNCGYNLLTSLDFKDSPILNILNCNNNNLYAIFIKNGGSIGFAGANDWSINPNLSYVCIDEFESFNVQQIILLNGLSNVIVNTYCSFNPGGEYNTITGSVVFDIDNNGCDVSDFTQSFIKLKMNDGTNDSFSFANVTGNFTFYTLAGNFTVTPNVENPSFFNFSPVDTSVNFPIIDNSVSTQNFCMTANGVHPDMEIVIAPNGPARPGFDAMYKIVYKNKGNQTISGNINFTYDDAVLDFVSATVAPDSQSTGSLSWNYTNLRPFENRSFYVTLNVNAPTDTPAVNSGDQLNFTATVNPIAGDETPTDNQFTFHQTVVGSYDPNDITCLEGDTVSPSEIGNYLHYVINFENTGTFEAQNVVVKEIIDVSQFDVNSLQILNSSDAVSINVTGNKAEFIFENIHLQPNVHGNITFKIKSKNTLQAGDTVSKNANIYFDYNAPITTINANTTFQTLSVSENELDRSISVYPNPSRGIVKVKANTNINSVQLYDIQGRLLQTKLIKELETNFDISEKANGTYFLKITSDKGMKVEKIVKE